jgi:hypothetical protein
MFVVKKNSAAGEKILLSTWSFNIAITKEDSRRENLETF